MRLEADQLKQEWVVGVGHFHHHNDQLGLGKMFVPSLLFIGAGAAYMFNKDNRFMLGALVGAAAVTSCAKGLGHLMHGIEVVHFRQTLADIIEMLCPIETSEEDYYWK